MDGPSRSERRAVQRFPADTIGPIQFREPPAEQSQKATVWDISVQGIGILADCDCAPGTTLAIRPRRLPKNSPELTADVRHTRKQSNGTWLLGCRFARILSIDELLALG